MKQIFRRGGIILSVLVLALIFSSCSPLAIRSQSSKISLTLPPASDVRRAFGPEAITSYMVGINSDSTGERCYDEVVDAGEHLEAEVPAGDYTVIIIGMEGLESNPGSYMLSGLAKQSGIKVLPNETTEVALKMVPLTITSNIPLRVEGKNPWTGAQLPVISNEGYTFDGWYANNDPSAFLTQFPDTENLTEVTITAKWTAKTSSGGHVDNEGHYAIVVKGVSNDPTPHTGEWGDPIPINQLDFSTLPQNTAFFLMDDLGTDATPYFLEALRKSVLFDGQVDGERHSITLGSVESTIQIDGNHAIRNLTINGNGATNTVPLFTVNSDGLLYFYNCEVIDVKNTTTGSMGGVVYNNGTLRIQNTTMTGCSASFGGAAYCTETSKLNIQDSVLYCQAVTKGNNLYLKMNASVCNVAADYTVSEVHPVSTSYDFWMDSKIETSWMTYDYQKPEWKQSWDNENVYTVKSADDFLALPEWVKNNNTASTYIKLANDITINDGDWESGYLTASNIDFCGTFDGQGHIITYLGLSHTSLCSSIAGSGVIKNLGIKGDIRGLGDKGSPFCLSNEGTIAGCYFEGTITGFGYKCAFGPGARGKVFGCVAVITSNEYSIAKAETSTIEGSTVIPYGSSITDANINDANNAIAAWNSQSSDNGCYYKLTLSEGVVGFTKIN